MIGREINRAKLLGGAAGVLLAMTLGAYAGLPGESRWSEPIESQLTKLDSPAGKIRAAKNFAAKTVIAGIQIDGSAEFIDATRKALLRLKNAGYLNEVSQFIKVIRQDKCSGIDVQTSVFYVGDPTWQAGILWFAGTIAHDSRHSRLYREAKAAAGGQEPAQDTWMGAEAEKRCLAFQFTVLQAMGADEATLNYIRELMKAPTYQNIGQGKNGLDVCSDRKWLS